MAEGETDSKNAFRVGTLEFQHLIYRGTLTSNSVPEQAAIFRAMMTKVAPPEPSMA
jgi:hypothetical protein